MKTWLLKVKGHDFSGELREEEYRDQYLSTPSLALKYMQGQIIILQANKCSMYIGDIFGLINAHRN